MGTRLHTKKIPNNSIERCNNDGNILYSCRIIIISSTFLWFILFSLAYFLYKEVSSVAPFYTDFIVLNILRQACNYFGKSAFLILLFVTIFAYVTKVYFIFLIGFWIRFFCYSFICLQKMSGSGSLFIHYFYSFY